VLEKDVSDKNALLRSVQMQLSASEAQNIKLNEHSNNLQDLLRKEKDERIASDAKAKALET
jgi:hypothetical protein